MKFETFRYGSINIKTEDIITFKEGLLGFPNCQKFTFIDEEDAAPFRIMQSLDVSNLAFVVIDPLIIKPNYHFKLTVEEIKIIEASTIENVSVYTIVNLAKSVKDATVNLQGPIVINNKAKLGHQFVLFDENYTVVEKLVNEQQTKKIDANPLKNASSG